MTMAGTALVTGADRGLGLALTAGLLARGWRVLAGQYLPDWPDLGALRAAHPDALHLLPLDVASGESVAAAARATGEIAGSLDLLVSNAGVGSPTSRRPIREAQDYPEMVRMYGVNALGALRLMEAFLPLLDAGRDKRLCFVSSEAGSIGPAARTEMYGYCMSKAALNMGVRLLFNDLRPQGYTFRLYHPGWVRGYLSGEKNLLASLEPEDAAVPALDYFLAARDDEDRLALRDWQGKEWPW